MNKVCACGQSISIVTRYRKPATIRKSPPTPEADISTTRSAACDHGPAAGPKFPLDRFFSLSVIIVENIVVDNATIIIIQINQVTFDIIKDRKYTMGLDSLYQIFWEFTQ